VPDKPKDKSKKTPPEAGSTEHAGITVQPPVAGQPPIILRPPPIFFGVTISSLSPSGAIVGGSGFVLTVNGAGFGDNSVVMWGSLALATTVISSTQLTAVVPPANIAVIGGVSVTVTRDTLTSNAATFNVIPNITQIVNTLNQVTQNFTTLQQFQAIQPGMIQALANLQTFVNIETSTINDQQSQLTDAQNQISSLTTQNAALNTQVTQQNATIAQLQSQLAATKTQTARPVDVAQSFKGVLDQIQQTARDAGGVQTTLTNMNIQLKALVNVQATSAPHDAAGNPPPPEAVLVFPDPSALPDPSTLSTVSFSFSAIPNIKAATATPPPPTPTPTPVPTPTPTPVPPPTPTPTPQPTPPPTPAPSPPRIRTTGGPAAPSRARGSAPAKTAAKRAPKK